MINIAETILIVLSALEKLLTKILFDNKFDSVNLYKVNYISNHPWYYLELSFPVRMMRPTK